MTRRQMATWLAETLRKANASFLESPHNRVFVEELLKELERQVAQKPTRKKRRRA